jgi:molybdopterin converting factor small subunit
MNLAAFRAPEPPAPCESGADCPATVVLLLFAEARVAAGTGREELSARSVAELLHTARARHGSRFAAVLERSRVWVNGEPAPPERLLTDGDEVAVLPPVSGGSTG